MAFSAISVWAGLGIVLMMLELLLPGLVVVFVGLGAVSVAGMLHLGWIESLPAQFSAWFATTLLYTFTLRVAIVRLYPGDQIQQDIDEDTALIGLEATVTETIAPGAAGRVAYGDTTWRAELVDAEADPIYAGARVQIASRDNITLRVQALPEARVTDS